MIVKIGRILAAALSGLLVYASYEPTGWWWAAPIGVALLFASLHGSSWRFGAVLGAVHGMALYLLLLPWIGEFVGSGPFLALCAYLSLYSVAFGMLAPSQLALRFGVFSTTCVYILVEWIRSTVPFGGFAWVRMGWGQIAGPLSNLAPVGGPALVSAATVFLGATMWWILTRAAKVAAQGITVIVAVTWRYALALCLFLFSCTVLPELSGARPPSGEITVAAVQGNVPRLGLDFNAQRMAVLENHVEATKSIDQPVDVVVWPENSADVDPFADPVAAGLIEDAVKTVKAPVIVGAVTHDEVGDRNQMVVFDQNAKPGEYHNKKFLQPFGEWMPWRDFFRIFSEKVDLAGDFKPGDGDGVLHVRAAQSLKSVAIGIATCYEVAFDAAGRDAVKAGAEILATPTNNATFGFSDMTYQQLAMSRMRAKELDRAVVVAATSGVSAIVLPDGSVKRQTKIFTQDVLIENLPLKTSLTFAVRWGHGIEIGLAMMGAICLCIPWLTRSKNRR
ncbi:apolipoprotein N-acyltransferase [Corynebacterium gerontici]|uniref:Apolipoprotein N-acyltransferase n=1 Tax=Corynebacterium gerontici TaxID=2079234 RepID=A0A3G6J5W6_9CORY|nr:apolipoprotein N-acyltransferase [Corynebacterium gerontici]AZA11404.1 Apolipoprotein N-acyltransferase [Corynebacterium gerontici]